MQFFYPFRTTDALLGERDELRKQEIYFAPPDQLNDPMEGFKDVYWQGDRIVWTNLIRHYLLSRTDDAIRICHRRKLSAGGIPGSNLCERYSASDTRSPGYLQEDMPVLLFKQ